MAILKAFEFGLNAGSAALIAALQPVLTALVSPFLLCEMNDRLRWCGIGVGFAGILVFLLWGGHASIWHAVPGSGNRFGLPGPLILKNAEKA